MVVKLKLHFINFSLESSIEMILIEEIIEIGNILFVGCYPLFCTWNTSFETRLQFGFGRKCFLQGLLTELRGFSILFQIYFREVFVFVIEVVTTADIFDWKGNLTEVVGFRSEHGFILDDFLDGTMLNGSSLLAIFRFNDVEFDIPDEG